MINNFGGTWTNQKIRIVVEYAKAYLEIMKCYPKWSLMYFDGFAGSGDILLKQDSSNISIIEDENINNGSIAILGAAVSILEIDEPIPFDMYYFVELSEQKASRLANNLTDYSHKKYFISIDDCNKKILDLAIYLRNKGKNYRVLAFIDPCGMNVKWSTIENLRGLGIDMWILAPTGLGANRMLTKNGIIPESWLLKLEDFFGIDRQAILQNFYQEYEEIDLYGNRIAKLRKDEKAMKKINDLYSQRLLTVFKYVSKPYIMRNKLNSIMFHLYLASNNPSAVHIANNIVTKYNKLN